MYVLLQENIADLGHIGDLVSVKPGYFRNFLLPRGLAVLASERRKELFEHQKRIAAAKKLKALAAAKEFANVLSTVSLTIQKPVGEEDRIFGSVTTQDLATAFQAMGHNIDRKSITILDDIKRVGVYKGVVKLQADVTAQFNIWVVAQSENT